MHGSRGWSAASLKELARRLGWATPACALVLAAALLVSLPVPAAAADPQLPPGAMASPPVQAVGSVEPKGQASTEQTQGRLAPRVVDEAHPVAPFGVPAPDKWRPTTDRPADVASRPDGAGTGYREGASVEDLSARTPFTTEFVNPDGSRTRRIYQDVAFVADSRGALTPVDATLRRGSGEQRWTPTASLVKVSFAPAGNSPDLARLDLGDGVSLGFGIDGASGVQPAILGEVARYRGVRAHADVELSTTASGVKEHIVLESAAAPTSWLFPLLTIGATPVWDATTGSVQFVDRRGNVSAGSRPVSWWIRRSTCTRDRRPDPTTCDTRWCRTEVAVPVGPCGWISTRRGWRTRRGCGR